MPLSKREQITGTIISALAILLLFVYLVVARIGFGNEERFLFVTGIIFLLSIITGGLLFTLLRRQHKFQQIDYLNIGTQRYILGIFMVFYGVPKLLGNFFDYQLFALDSKLGDVSEFELAWYYFGKNRWQELFAGIMEFVPGLLLFPKRTYYIAALVLLPVTAQVFILNLFFKIGGITFQAATILLACNLYIIYSQKENIIRFFKSVLFQPSLNWSRRSRIMIQILKSFVLILVLLVILMQLMPVLSSHPRQAYYKKLVGVYRLDRITKNGIAYTPLNDSLLYKDIYIEKQNRWNILRRFNNQTDAFVVRINDSNDSISIYINKGGIGDSPDILDSATVLSGTYRLQNDSLLIDGSQLNQRLQLNYSRQKIKPKKWFW